MVFAAGAAYYLEFREEFSTVDGEVDVCIVVAGGDDDSVGVMESGAVEDVDVGGVAGNVVFCLGDGRIFFDDAEGYFALLECLGGGQADAATTEDDDGFICGHIDAEEFVVGIELCLSAGENENGDGGYDGIGSGGEELTAFPEPGDGDASDFAEVCLGNGFAHKGSSGGGGFGDEKVVYFADYIYATAHAGCATGEKPAEEVFHFENVGGTGEAENFCGFAAGDIGDDGDVFGDFANGEGDAGVDHVFTGDDNQRGLGCVAAAIGFRLVEFAYHDGKTFVIETEGLGQIGEDEDIGDV